MKSTDIQIIILVIYTRVEKYIIIYRESREKKKINIKENR